MTSGPPLPNSGPSSSGPAPRCGPEGHCVTCADEGVPMRVMDTGSEGVAVCVDEAGQRTDVMTDLVGAIAEGEMVLVHAGTALARIADLDTKAPEVGKP